MLSPKQLGRLRRAVGGRPCLSVYVASGGTDPAAQGAWSRRLQNAVREERNRIQEDRPEDVDSFDRGWKLLEQRLPAGTGALGSPGWAGFAIGERVLHDTELRADVGTSVRWSEGPILTPYVRALSRVHTIVLVLVDARRARVFRRVDGRVIELDDRSVEVEEVEPDGPGMMKAARSTSGVRGETRRDAARRALSVATERLVRSVAKSLETLSEGASALVLGGIERVASAVYEALPESLHGSVQHRPDLEISMSIAEIEAAMGSVLEQTVRRWEGDVLRSWGEDGRSRGLSLAGWNSAIRALDEGAVERLLLSTRLIEDHPDDAETLVSRVLDGAGDAVELTGEAGQRLDVEGGGIGVCLRFAPSMESA